MAIDVNAKQSLSVYPHIEEIAYSDPISSEKLNEQLESLQESVLRTLIRSQEINNSLTTFEAAVSAQATALGSYFNSLSYTTEINKAFITAFDNGVVAGTSKINIDALYGYISLATIAQYSKIPRQEGYDGKVSPEVRVAINGVEQAFDSAPYRAVDNSAKTLWFDEFAPNSQVVFELNLPPSITKRFNYIQIDPFPVFGFTIDNVTYQDLYGNYHDIDENFSGPHNPFDGNRAFPTKIWCSPKEFNGTIKIYGTTLANGFFGFSNIDVGFLDFNDTSQQAHAEFLEFRNKPGTYILTSAILDFYYDSANGDNLISAGDIISARIIATSESNGQLQGGSKYIDLDLSSDREIDLRKAELVVDANQSMFLQYTMKENNLTTPVIRGVKLEYMKKV